MQLSETVKLYLTKQQKSHVLDAMHQYIEVVNRLVKTDINGISIAKYSSKDVQAELPAALRNQCIRDAKSIIKKHYKACHVAVLKNRRLAKSKKLGKKYVTAPKLPVLKKPCCYVNNQNFKVKAGNVEFPVMVNGKSTRISVKTSMTQAQKDAFESAKLGTMRIVLKDNKLVAQIVYEIAEPGYLPNGNIMGIDLGIKCPAVGYCTDGLVKFYGNGRKNKYMRRHYAYLRKKLQKAKHQDAVERINNKEQRIMKDLDHKLSHDIINSAVEHGVKIIKLEQLSNIRSATRRSRKNNHSLHSWSFYRLAQYIEYKAKLAGIQVEYVNPAYTSQKCPSCGDIHHAKDRTYTCDCGLHLHRELVGAVNICNSTEYVGGSDTRRAA